MTTPSKLMASIFSMDAYNHGYGQNLVVRNGAIGSGQFLTESSTRISDPEFQNGFYAIAYKWNGQTIISYRGTDNNSIDPNKFSGGSDILNGWTLGAGYPGASQANLALSFYNTATSLNRTGAVTLTGHSLGGGLAGYVSLVTGAAATIFDNMPYAAAAIGEYISTDLQLGYTLDQVMSGGTPASTWPKATAITQVVTSGEILTAVRAEAASAATIAYLAAFNSAGIAKAPLYTTQVVASASSLELSTTTDSQIVDSQSGLGRNPVDLHSIALEVMTLYFNGIQTNTDWYSAGKYLYDAYFKADIGKDLSLKQGADTTTTGVTGTASEATQLLEAIAYSAADGTTAETMPFGNSAAASLFGDASRLGRVLQSPLASSTLIKSAGAIAEIAVEYAGVQALNKSMTGTTIANDPAGRKPENGVITLLPDGKSLNIDLSAPLWSQGAIKPKYIIGRADLISSMLLNEGAFSSTDVLNVYCTLLWGPLGLSAITSATVATAAASFSGTLFGVPDSNGNSYADLFAASEASDTITGSAGNDVILGGGGNDTINGGGGNNILVSGAGSSTFVGGAGKDVFFGGGTDTVDYSYLAGAGPATFTMAALPSPVSPTVALNGFGFSTSNTDSDYLFNISTVRLTARGDVVKLTSLPSALQNVTTIDAAGHSIDGLPDILDLSGLSQGVTYFNGRLGYASDAYKAISRPLNFIGFTSYYLPNAGASTFLGNVENSTIYTGSGNATILGLSPGSKVIDGSGKVTISYSGQTAVSGLKATDLLLIDGALILAGAARWAGSASAYAWAMGGLIGYGLNQLGDLIIHSPILNQNYPDMYILGWSSSSNFLASGVQTGGGGISLAQLSFAAFNIYDRPQGTDWLKSQLNLLCAVRQIAFGGGAADPLVLDLNGDGFGLIQRTSISPSFDINASLYAVKTGWVGPSDGFLVRDINKDGKISDTSEMFGGATSGFSVLATLDGNHDSQVSAADNGLADFNGDGKIDTTDSFAALQVWVDTNQDGVTEAGELKSLASLGITSLGTSSAVSNTAINGNVVAATGLYKKADGSTGAMADVNLSIDAMNSTYQGAPITITTQAAAEPNLKGSGTLVSLREALSLHPEYLSSVNTALAKLSTPDLASLQAAVMPVLTAWAMSSPIKINGSIISGNAAQGALSDIPILSIRGAYADYAYSAVDSTTTVNGQSRKQRVWTFVTGAKVTAVAGADGVLPDLSKLAATYGVVTPVKTTSPTDVNDIFWTATYASGLKVTAEQPSTVAAATAQAIFKGSYTDGSGAANAWSSLAGPQIAFFQRYLGQLLPTGAAPQNVASALQYLQTLTSLMTSDLQLLAVRLAVQSSPLASIFSGISYDQTTDQFVSNGPQQLAPVFQKLFTLAAGQPDPIAYLKTWKPFLDIIIADYRQPSGVENTYGFVAQNVIAAFEAAGSSFNMLDAVDALGVPKSQFIIGTGVINGTSGADIFYLDGSGQTAQGGAGPDTFVVGKKVGTTVINTVTPALTATATDTVRFTTLRPQDVTATRDGLDLVLKVNTSQETLRISNQFTGPWPGADGRNYAPGYGVAEIVFSDGTVWEPIDMALAVAKVLPNGGLQTGTDATDVFRTGPGSDTLQGGGGSDVYIADMSGGADVITDTESDPFRNPVNLVSFAPGITRGQLTFTRTGFSNDVIIGTTQSSATLTIKDQFASTQTLVFGELNLSQIQLFNFADGTGFSASDLQQILIQQSQTSRNDSIYGFDGTDDILDGGAGADVLSGGNGNDTYVFGHGYGSDTVQDNGTNILDPNTDTLKFNADVTAAQVKFTLGADPHDLLVTLDDGSVMTIKGEFTATFGIGTYWFNRVENFSFADGSSLTWSQVLSSAILNEETTGNDTVNGSDISDTLDGGLGNDLLVGGFGDDTYIYNAGYGADTISDVLQGGNDTLKFGTGLTPNLLTISRPAGNIYSIKLSFTGQSGSILLTDETFWGDSGIETFVFGNGVSWSKAQLEVAAIAAEQLVGGTILGFDYANDTIEGKTGSTLQGLGGDDTYLYKIGDGVVAINDGLMQGNDTLKFGPGLLASNLVISRIANGNDVSLSFKGQTGSVTLTGEFFGSEGSGVETIIFGDGTSWTLAALEQATLAAEQTAGGVITGFDTTSDTIEGKTGSTLQGLGGDDTYVYKNGDGAVVISEGILQGNDKLTLGAGLSSTVVKVSRPGNGLDAVLTFTGVTGSVTITNAFAGNNCGVETVLFSDGVSWGVSDLQKAAIKTEQAAGGLVLGFDGVNDTIEGKTGSTLQGLGGDDTYLYNSGDGTITLLDGAGQGNDTLKFGSVFTTANLKLARPSNGNDVTLSFTGQTGSVTLTGEFLGSGAGVETIVFGDGTSWSLANLEAAMLTTERTAGGTITGFSQTSDTLQGKTGATLVGLSGDDTYLYNVGDGTETIRDDIGGGNDVLRLGAGITAAKTIVTKTGSGADAVLTFTGVTGSLKLLNEFSGGGAGVESIIFADGTTWSVANLASQAVAQKTITGTNNNDSINPGTAASYMQGLSGDDAYVFNAGYGIDTIFEDQFQGNNDTLTFGAGLTSTNVTLSRGGANSNDVTVGFTGQTGSMTLLGEFANFAGQGVDKLIFADGVTWTTAQLEVKMIAAEQTHGGSIIGFNSSADTLEGKTGDVLSGLSGDDTYLWNSGDGVVTIFEDQFQGNNDTLKLGTGLTSKLVTVARSATNSDNVTLSFTGFAGSITLLGEFANFAGQGVDTISFADGVTWTTAQLESAMLTAEQSKGGTILGFNASNDTMEGHNGDTLSGLSGDDTYLYNSGDGNVAVFDDQFQGNNDTLKLGTGLTTAKLIMARTGYNSNDLLMSFHGVSGSVALVGQFFGSQKGVENIIFGDGTLWRAAQLHSAFIAQEETKGGQILGFADSNDTLEGHSGDVLTGLSGDDTYLYKAGEGTITINEAGFGGNDTLQLGPGLTAQTLNVTRTGVDNNDAILSFAGTTGSIRIAGEFYGPSTGVESIIFGDGTRWAYSDLQAKLLAQEEAAGGQILGFDNSNDTLEGHNGDTLNGKGWDDTYLYNIGDGSVTIQDTAWQGGNDTLKFGLGITAQNIVVTRSGGDNNDAVLTFNGQSGTIVLTEEFGGAYQGVEHLQFADGTSWDNTALLNHVSAPAAAAAKLSSSTLKVAAVAQSSSVSSSSSTSLEATIKAISKTFSTVPTPAPKATQSASTTSPASASTPVSATLASAASKSAPATNARPNQSNIASAAPAISVSVSPNVTRSSGALEGPNSQMILADATPTASAPWWETSSGSLNASLFDLIGQTPATNLEATLSAPSVGVDAATSQRQLLLRQSIVAFQPDPGAAAPLWARSGATDNIAALVAATQAQNFARQAQAASGG